MVAEVYFFGVSTGSSAGHYLHRSAGGCAVYDRRSADVARGLPEPLHRLDGVWCWERPRTSEESRFHSSQDPQHEGRAFVHYVEGWTVVSWWDRSGDSRGGSNSAFLAIGRRPFAEMLEMARAAFPREITRMEARYPITRAGADLPPDDTADAATAFVETYDALHPSARDAVWALLCQRRRTDR